MKQQLDPLYTIFEQHLCNFQDPNMDRKTFVAKVVSEYITYLRRSRIAVPPSLERQITEELGDMVNTMLIKKIYGCFDMEEFQRGLTTDMRKAAEARYQKLRSETG